MGKWHHGKGTRLYTTWKNMRNRCSNSNRPDFKWYGGKGIKVCDEWNDFTIFRDWALNNGYTDELTIDRIDSNKNYEPDNCQWITQAKNSSKSLKRKITPEIFQNVLLLKSQGLSGSQIARLYNVYPSCINKKLKQIKTKE